MEQVHDNASPARTFSSAVDSGSASAQKIILLLDRRRRQMSDQCGLQVAYQMFHTITLALTGVKPIVAVDFWQWMRMPSMVCQLFPLL